MVIGLVGRRNASAIQLERCYQLGYALGRGVGGGYPTIFRSGNARGCDQTYIKGVVAGAFQQPEHHTNPKVRIELYIPWLSFEAHALIGVESVYTVDNATQDHIALAREAHPMWETLSPAVKKLMLRNAMLIVGCNLLFAMPDWGALGLGGTGHTMRMAERLGITTVQLG